MEEIKVGEYIRAPYGTIEKVEEIVSDGLYRKVVTEYNGYTLEWLKYLKVKHSFDIKKLIEEGDFVNGYICKRIPNFDNKMCNFDLNLMQWIPLEDIDVWYNVVTKEQFDSSKYIVGDESSNVNKGVD